MNSSSKNSFRFPEVRVVEASAGSGKTYALAKRYLQLIFSMSLNKDALPIRNILAITFTNKAAFEMKSRILGMLKRIAFGDLPKAEFQDIFSGFDASPQLLREKARALLDELIHSYNFFQVQTIDKFINSLLCGCAFKINLTSNFRIRTNAADYLQYCIDELIDQGQARKDIAVIFKDFLHNYLYLENRSGWFPKNDVLSIITTLFHQNNSYGSLFEQSSIGADEIFKTKSMILEEISLLQEIMPEKVHATFAKGIRRFVDENKKSFDIDSLPDSLAQENIPVKKGGEVSGEVEQIWSVLRLNVSRLCEQEALALFDPYIRIFDKVLTLFTSVTSKEDILFLGELNKKARLLFDEEFITVEELYYRLATRFHHYLVDEFQDTSRLQWKNLKAMAEEALSTGGSLFYVGDKKQAIYSFRGGDVSLFDEVKKEFSSFNVIVDKLTKNWRSQKAVVDFNNEIFSLKNLNSFLEKKEAYEAQKKKKTAVVLTQRERKRIEDVFENSLQSVKEENNEGYVSLEYIDVDKKEERNAVIQEKLTALIRDLQKRFALSDIAILTRNNSEVEEVTRWLLEEDIFVASERTSNIQENAIVGEIVSFLKFLNSPIDNVSFAQFLLGEIFPKAAGIKSDEMHEFIFQLRNRIRQEKDVYLYIEFRKKYPKLWENYFEEFFRNVGLYPLYELLISIYDRLGVLENFKDLQGFLMHFLEIVKRQEEDHSGVSAFLEHFENMKGEDLYVRLTDADAVKIMTVHKAKGLEFPVVILPFLGMDVQVGSTGEDNQQSYILQQKEEHIQLLRLKSKYLIFSDKLYQIYRKEYQKALLSELNNVYVALTRPVHEIYGFIPKRVGNSFNILKFLIPEDQYQKGQKGTYSARVQERGESFKLQTAKYKNWIEYLEEEFLSPEGVEHREKIKDGEIYHTIFSLIKNLSGQDIMQVLNQLKIDLGMIYPEGKDLGPYFETVEKLLGLDACKPFFFLDEAQVFTEKEVVNKYGDTLRIDRLIIRNKDVWIIDYKSSKENEEEHQRQVKEYMEIVSEIYKGYKVAGFLVYIMEQKVVEII